MRLFRVTDTTGRVWYLNRDWILRISKCGRGTDIQFAMFNSDTWMEENLLNLEVKESVNEVKELLDGADMPMGRSYG